MREANCPECGSSDIEAMRSIEQLGGVFGVEYKAGQLQAAVDWERGGEPIGSTSYRCMDCQHEVFDPRKLIPEEQKPDE